MLKGPLEAPYKGRLLREFNIQETNALLGDFDRETKVTTNSQASRPFKAHACIHP